MSLIRNVDHIFATRGIGAVVVVHGQERAERGDPEWTSLLRAALALRELAEQPSIRVTLAEHSIVVQREGEQCAAILMISGDPVAKSLKRMIRRMAARVRPPLKESEPSHSPAPSPEAHYDSSRRGPAGWIL